MSDRNGYDLSVAPDDGSVAARYLANARAYVAAQRPPPDYRQITRSHNAKPIHDDPTKPAILDTCNFYFGTYILSISVPDFIPQDATLHFPEAGGVEFRPGFSNLNLGTSLRQYLVSHGVHCMPGKFKSGFDEFSKTNYVELYVSRRDYEKGRRLISELVHGTSPLRPGRFSGETGMMLRGIRKLGRLIKTGLGS